MRTDATSTAPAKARTLSRRTARKMKTAQALTALFLGTMFPADLSSFAPRTTR